METMGDDVIQRLQGSTTTISYSTLEFCPDAIFEHPGQIEIVENGVLKETISAAMAPMSYKNGVIEVEVKECIIQVPIVKIDTKMYTIDGKRTDKAHAYAIIIKTYGVDGTMLSITRSINEDNKKNK